MANLKTRNVFLDTEVFEAYNFNFDATGITELVRLAQANFVRVFLTTVTIGEVYAHIAEKINDASSKLKKFRNEEGRILQNVSTHKALLEKLDKQKCIEEIKAKFRAFLSNVEVTVIDVRSVDPEKVFGDYFEWKAPFGVGRRKEEFPDAFAQHALTNWCEKAQTDMYVVSANRDWHSQIKHLLPLAKLGEFLDAAVKDEAGEKLATDVLRLYAKHIDKVQKAIEDAFKDSEFYTSDVDGDVNEVKIKSIKFDQPLVIEVDEASSIVSVDVEIKYVADVSYLSDDEGIWDDEDHEWSYRPTKYTDAEEFEEFEAELAVQYDPGNDDVFDVSCTISKTFRVTVLPTDYELK